MQSTAQLDETIPSPAVDAPIDLRQQKKSGSESDKVTAALNTTLAHLIDLQLRAKRAHWNAKGGSFYSLHKMLDDFACDLEALADEVGERVMAVGGVAAGTVFEVAGTSTLKRQAPRSTNADEILIALKTDYDTARMVVRKCFEVLAIAEDDASMDIVLGAMKLLDKQRSFLRAQIAT